MKAYSCPWLLPDCLLTFASGNGDDSWKRTRTASLRK